MLRSASTALITTSAGRLGPVESPPPQPERTVVSRRDAVAMALRVMQHNSATVAEFVQTNVWHAYADSHCKDRHRFFSPRIPYCMLGLGVYLGRQGSSYEISATG